MNLGMPPEDYEVRKDDRCKCRYCDLSGLDNFDVYLNLGIDHIIPVGQGGDESKENKAVACGECNTLKGKYVPVGNNREERIADARRLIRERRQRSRSVFDKIMDDLLTHSPTTPFDGTTKQMSDACEMFIAAELTLTGGIPSIKMPDCWPDYDVITQPKDGSSPQRISVKARTFKRGANTYVAYDIRDKFDWLAIVLAPGDNQRNRRTFIVPKSIADAKARHDSPTAQTAHERYWRQDEIAKVFPEFENNFSLSSTGAAPLEKRVVGV
jgi:hypothetical protein